MTHEDFIQHCKMNGIQIEKISRNYVYVSKPEIRIILEDILPNTCTQWGNTGLLADVEIRNWSYRGTTILDLIRTKQKIMAIKIIREKTGCGLKDAKDIVEHNWSEWLHMAT